MRMIKGAVAVVLAGVSLLAAGAVSAHTRLVASVPAANATVRTSPKSISLTFNERVVPAFSKFELSMPEHDMNVPVATTVSRDGKSIVGAIKTPLHAGSYVIRWTAAGSDGHRMEGQVAFKVE